MGSLSSILSNFVVPRIILRWLEPLCLLLHSPLSTLNNSTFRFPTSLILHHLHRRKVIPLGCAFQSRSCTVAVQDTTRQTHSTPRNKETMYNSPVSSSDFGDTDWPIAPPRTEKKKKDKSTIKKSRASTNDEAECSLLSFPHVEEGPLNGSKKAVERTRFRARRFKRYGSKEWKDGAMTESGDQEKKDGKVNESFVVVKRSVDPFEDFKKSMLEMIVEKQMFEHKELEQLLMSFLSLNSRMHHRVIVEAFTEILKEVFCG
ncbi:UNVERIFIED_CONTAM: Transcription repressor OFP7 [Sesamum radiatum]|uniref:Transcription repressor n=1 Tax=Sesamum radiatum TaxID=300843 RepID=A0AAW2PYV8_SESRA